MKEGLDDLMNKVTLGDKNKGGDDETLVDNELIFDNNVFADSCLVGRLVLKRPCGLDAMKSALL